MNRSARLMLALLVAVPGIANAECPPRNDLLVLKQSKFSVADAKQRNATALSLVDCLANTDPAIRDGAAFEGLSGWLRGKQLDSATVVQLGAALEKSLAAPPDATGFRRPFAALVLSEVARADRVTPTFSAQQLESMVQATETYVRSIDDHRGFTNGEGWRHAVAHSADLVLQLGVNPRLDAGQVQRLVDALAIQAAPASGHAYIHTEPDRMARAVFFIRRRGVLPDSGWAAWLAKATAPAPIASWNQAFESEQGLGRRHDVLAFLYALHFSAITAGDARGTVFAQEIAAAIEKVRGG
jgi:hypothetical protein